MAKREIKHVLGTITYEYNDAVSWTEIDQEMADGLAHCLLTNDKATEEIDALFKRGMEFKKVLKPLNEKHEAVGEALKKAQDVAGGYVGAIELGQYGIADMLTESTNAANAIIQEQNEEVTAAHADYSKLSDDMNKWIDQEEENNEEIFTKLSGLSVLGYNAEKVATDFMSFDRARDSVCEVLSAGERSQEGKYNSVLDATREFELLLVKIDGQQKLWKEFCARLVLIEYIGKLRSGSQSTSFN